jgi:hypothetical protein
MQKRTFFRVQKRTFVRLRRTFLPIEYQNVHFACLYPLKIKERVKNKTTV